MRLAPDAGAALLVFSLLASGDSLELGGYPQGLSPLWMYLHRCDSARTPARFRRYFQRVATMRPANMKPNPMAMFQAPRSLTNPIELEAT